ncbi:MAG: hypothetical protein V2J14_05335 [Erythrobacter sp.]|jgi:hypothetical protein|nr:hypothetical protein [Erythrobacter sp.]
MIDNIALFIGHGLLAIAFLRLAMREGLDVDPLLDAFRQRAQDRREGRREGKRSVSRSTPPRGDG